MRSLAVRHRLVYPVTAILALGLVSFPQPSASAPRVAEVSAVRLQAEVSSLVAGIADDAAATTPPAAAASTLVGTAAATAVSCVYPCTVFDRFLSNLPENIRYAILPAVYAVAWVVGLVKGLAYLVVSPILKLLNIDPFQNAPLKPAAASIPVPADSPAAATDPIGDPRPSSSEPGTGPRADADGPSSRSGLRRSDSALSTATTRAGRTEVRAAGSAEAAPAAAITDKAVSPGSGPASLALVDEPRNGVPVTQPADPEPAPLSPRGQNRSGQRESAEKGPAASRSATRSVR